jgi:hypothetical protein
MHLRGKCNSGSNICSDMERRAAVTDGLASVRLAPLPSVALAAAMLALSFASHPVAAQQRPSSESAVPVANLTSGMIAGKGLI